MSDHPAEPPADLARQLLNLAAAAGQLLAPPLIFPDGFAAVAPAGRLARGPTPLEPAGYAFVIWGAIFAGSFAYAVLQARPAARRDPLYRAIGWRTATCFTGAVLWLAAARFGPLWATGPLIAAMWVAAVRALVTAGRSALPRARRALVLVPLSLYAGWLSVATFANLTEVLHAYGFTFLGLPLVAWTLGGLLVAGALAAAILRAARYPLAYVGAVAWALVGVAVANVTRGLSGAVAAVAVAEAAALLALWVVGRRGAAALVVAAAAILSPRPAGAQAGVVAGRVVSAATQEPLSGARVRVADAPTEIAAESDGDGRFVLRGVPVGVRRLEVRRLGFAPLVRADVAVSAGRPAELTIALEAAPARLTGVTVTPGYFPALPPASAPVSTQTLGAEEIRRAPGVQEDVVRALAVLPGVSAVNPVANDVVVRGGGPAENLYVVDDVEVPSINHYSAPGTTGGVLSIFPVALVSEASLSAGGFGARYGDRTASVTTIALREGSRERAASQLTLSATGAGAIAEGPLGERASLIVGARRSYLDLLFAALGLPFVPTYTDVTAKLVARPSARQRVSLFVAGAVDRVGLRPETADDRYDLSRTAIPRQDSYIAGVGWQRVLPRGLLAVTLGRSWARFRVSQSDSGSADRAPSVVFRADAEEGETSLRADVTYRVAAWLTVDAGDVAKRAGRLRYGVVIPGTFRTDADGRPRPLAVDTAFVATRNAAYAQGTARVGDRLRLTAGARVDTYAFLGDVTRVGPRGAATLALDAVSSVTLSGGRYWQAPPLAWLVGDPANPRALRPFRADQAVVGWRRSVRPALKVQVEAYVKRYAAYPARVFRPRAVLQPTGTDVTTDVPLGLEPLLSGGRGHAWGVEAFAQRKLSAIPVYGLLSLSANRTRFRALDGVAARGAFDLPIAVSALAGWRPDARWELAARLRAGSGLPTTPYVTEEPGAGTLDYARYNAGPRLAPLLALDVRVDRRWSLGDRGQLVTYLDVQDATARRNETFPLFDQRTGRVERQRFTGLLPSIGLTWERGL